MLYCQKCKAEYEDSEKVCPQCGEKLEPKQVEAKSSDTAANDKEAFLISVNEGFEAEMVEGSLRSAGIPYVRKGHGGPAGFSRYDTKYESHGADFYVPSALLVRAKTLLPPVEGAQEIQDTMAAQEDSQENDASKTSDAPNVLPEETPTASPAKRILCVILFFAVAALVIFGVDAVMNIFRAMMGYK